MHQGDSYLVLLNGDGAVVKQFPRSHGIITLGRASKNDPGTKDPSQGKFRSDNTKVMSSRHAQISWDGDYAHITDLGSTNGVVITRDEQKVSLKPNVAYRIFERDQITFGKQVSEKSTGEIICRPLTLEASLRSSPSIPLPSTASRSTAPSVPLVRGRTLTGDPYSKSPFDCSSDEEDIGPTQCVEDKVADSLKSTSFFPAKRGFGLSDEDVLISPDDEDSSLERLQSVNLSDIEVVNNDDQSSRWLKPAPSGVESVSAASHVAVSGSPAPGASDVEMVDASSRTVSRADSRDARSPRPAWRPLMPDDDGDLAKAIKHSMQSFDRPPSPVSPEMLKTLTTRLREDEEDAAPVIDEERNKLPDERQKRMAELEAALDRLRRPAPSVSRDAHAERLSELRVEKATIDAPFDTASVASHLPSPVISEANDSDQEQDAMRYSFSPELDAIASVLIEVKKVEGPTVASAGASAEELAAMEEQAEEEELAKTRQMQSQLEWVESEDEMCRPCARQATRVALIDGRPLWRPDDDEEADGPSPATDHVEPPNYVEEAGTPAFEPEFDAEKPRLNVHVAPPLYGELVFEEADSEPQPAAIEPAAPQDELGLAHEVLVDLMAFKAASQGFESEDESEDDDQHESEDGHESSSEISAIEYDEEEEEDEMEEDEEDEDIDTEEEEEESDGMSEWSGLDEVHEEEELDRDSDPELSGRFLMELDDVHKDEVASIEEFETPAPLLHDVSPELVNERPVGDVHPLLDFTGDHVVVTDVQDGETQAAAVAVEVAEVLEIEKELPPVQLPPSVENIGLAGADFGAIVAEEKQSDEENSSSPIEKVSASTVASSQINDVETHLDLPLPNPSRKRRLDDAGFGDSDEPELVALVHEGQAFTALDVQAQKEVPVAAAAAEVPLEVPQPKRRRLNIPFKSFALGLVTGVIGTVAGLAAIPTSDC
ncbi:hypothetical protein JCM10295v2_000475 [Rhodotorula toruloides]